MNKNIIIAATVAVILVAVIAACFVTGVFNGSNTDHSEGSLVGNTLTGDGIPSNDSRLWVYGNSNEDDEIDASDIAYLQGVIDGNNSATVLSDANADGLIDSKDIDYLERIIASEDMNVYYVNNYYCVAKVSWPVNTIAIGYCSGAYCADLTGVCDKVTMVDSTIDSYWYVMNSNFASASSFGDTETPDYEAMIAKGIDVYVVGYCDATADALSPSKLNPAGIDVMFITTCDNSGIDYPNEYIDRSILMFAYLLQGDTEKTHEYLDWHDEVLNTLEAAADTIADEDKAAFMMARSSPSYDTDGKISITGKNNTNNIHAEWVGVYAVGQYSSYLPSNYNNLTAEQILTVIASEAKDNTIYYMDNEHDGIRQQRLLEDCIPADIEMLSSSSVNIHYLGMSREAGNSPLYVVELAFYQNVMYPDLDTGMDYKELFEYYFDNFASEDYSEYVSNIEDFFWDYGEA